MEIGLVFPGQGSQHVGMGKFAYENFKEAKQTFEEAADTLGLNFKKLCFEGPDSDLALTTNTQPALLVVSTALVRTLSHHTGFNPVVSAGHSLGEYSALVASGSLLFSDALRAVRLRGQYMQEAVPVGEGAMLAVLGLADEDVVQICHWATKESGLGVIEPANFNAPGQVVISGTSRTVQWLRDNYKPEAVGQVSKGKFIPLNVSAPFHCSLMKPAQEQMKIVLDKIAFTQPKFPIVQNVTGQYHEVPTDLRQNLVLQIASPVKWVQSVRAIADSGVTKLVELGPGKVLAGLVKKIDGERIKTLNIQSLEEFKLLEVELS